MFDASLVYRGGGFGCEMNTSLEEEAASLLYRVACDLETEVKATGQPSRALDALERWRRMDAALSEYRDLQRTLLGVSNNMHTL